MGLHCKLQLWLFENAEFGRSEILQSEVSFTACYSCVLLTCLSVVDRLAQLPSSSRKTEREVSPSLARWMECDTGAVVLMEK